MKLYLSGPITGVLNYRENFQDAVTRLRWAGYTDVINPAELCCVLPPEHTKYEEYMNICMDMLASADAIVLLPGWEKSIGANREIGYAMGTDKIIIDLETMVEGNEK